MQEKWLHLKPHFFEKFYLNYTSILICFIVPNLNLKRKKVKSRTKVTSFEASLFQKSLSELYKRFDLIHCSESKLFNTFKKLTVKIGVPKWLRYQPEQFWWLLGFTFSWRRKRMSIFLQYIRKRWLTDLILSFNLPYLRTILGDSYVTVTIFCY